MQIVINSDKNISMHAKLSNLIESDLHRILNRYEDELTRVEVHLTDENGDKSGLQDKRCLLEARPKNHQSLTVTNDSDNIQTAVSGAANKMQRLLVTTFGRIEDKHKDLKTRQSGEGQNLVLKPEIV
jgi:ribosomal subunit interface protein